MKIGILTFHSQLNYGGVLQCWAQKMALEGVGRGVVVDRGFVHQICSGLAVFSAGCVKRGCSLKPLLQNDDSIFQRRKGYR